MVMNTGVRCNRLLARAAAVVLVALAVFGSARAADEDLPSRVGRLADFGGIVYVSSGEQPEDWVEALRNASVTTGDNLWVTADGRAEIDYGGGQFRLAGDTNVHVSRLDDRLLALFVAQGRVIVRVRVLDVGDAARIDTPNTQLALTRPGLYRIEVSEDRLHTTLVVREGEATATLARGIQQLLPGQSATISGDEPDYADVRNGFFVDGFDSWSADRDRRYERSRSASYVSRQMIGYADLDEYGAWETYPEYGAVWFPRGIGSDWAPYRYGRWTWVAGWGWTWVDDAPWGYAPFHYGRWAYVGTRWGWIPGGYVARPVWAPALVAWYGGSDWSFSATLGAPVFGWVALGWGEPYIPSWRNCSHRCWTMYNRPYAVNLAERPNAPPTRYTNWASPGGVTAVPSAVFTGRQPVHSNLVAVRPQNVASAPVLAGAPVVAKPTSGTIPHAKPTTAAPPPAERFIRKPLQVAPAPGAPTPQAGNVPAYGGRPAGPTSVPPAIRPQPSPSVAAPVRGQPPAASAPPSGGAPSARQAAPAYAPGTWGAPVAPTAPSGSAPAAPRDARPAAVAPAVQGSGGTVPRSAPPASPPGQQGIALPRSAPPTSVPPAQPVAPRAAAPSAAHPPQQGIPMPRSAPPATSAPPLAPQPRGMPQPAPSGPVAAPPPAPVPAPAPQGVRSPPQQAKPAPKGDGDKPAAQR
jgi:hypothetical protein